MLHVTRYLFLVTRYLFGLFLPLWSTQKVGFGERFVSFIETEVFPELDRENIYLPKDIRAPGEA